MVGHTGVIPAAVAAVEDGRRAASARSSRRSTRTGGALHRHRRPRQLRPHARARRLAQHRPLDQPGAADRHRRRASRCDDGGILADVAPTALELLGIEQPAAMTGVARWRLTLGLGLAGRAQRPGQASIRDQGPRRRRPRRACSISAHGPVETPGLHPAGDQGKRSRALGGRGRRARLRDGARQHLPPAPLARARSGSPQRGGLHGFMGWERAIITDSGGFQVFSLAHGGVADEIKGRRGRRRRGGRRCSRSPRRGCASAPTSTAPSGSSARGLDGGPGGARLRHRARLRRVHARTTPTATTRRARPSAPTAGSIAASPGTSEQGPAARRCSGSSRAASTRTCGAQSAERGLGGGVDGIAIGGTLGRDKEEMHGVARR